MGHLMNKLITTVYILNVLFINNSFSENVKDYMTRRSEFIAQENTQRTGGSICMNEKEEKANSLLMALKRHDIDSGEKNNNFPPSQHFFIAKTAIENSAVFKIIKLMPKGAALHLHDSSMVDVWWLIKTATYMDNCYIYLCSDKLKFKFARAPPPPLQGCEWKLVSDVRRLYDPEEFDTWLYYNMTMIVKNPATEYPNIKVAWQRFYSLFGASDGLVFYEPVFKAYFYEALQEFYDDNVQYIEFRGLLTNVYNLDGVTHNRTWSVATYQNISKQFLKTHSGFTGSKFIYSSSRSSSSTDIMKDIKLTLMLLKQFPSYVLGYDLVGEEDPGHSLKYFINDLLYPSMTGQTMKYFFHAGETDWEGLAVDDNLVDAVLLNTTRIGHGYALLKHPKVLNVVRSKRIPVEVCPISNQVLKLVDDLRNHPASVLLANNLTVVISSDDPGLWGARGLSYDFYEAFMGLAGAEADLRFLKQLAINSIWYSGMTNIEKHEALALWQQKWDIFIDTIIKSN